MMMQATNEANYISEEELIALHTLYYNDPILFARDILNIEPDEQQCEVISALYNDRIVSVKSGRGAGKTVCAAIIVWHFLCTRFCAQVYAAAPTAGTLTGALWPTLAKLHADMEPIYKDQFEVLSTSVKHKEYPITWFAMARTARAENSDALAGSHAANMLFVIDEASGLSDGHFEAIFGSLTEENNYLLMISNPRRLSGPFYESHRPHSAKIFKQLTMSAIKSKWVKKESIRKWEVMFGKDSNQYRIEVEGNFPDREDGSIIPLSHVLEAIERNKARHYEQNMEIAEGEIVWGVDCGGGGDKSILIRRRGRKVYNDIKRYNFKDTMKLVSEIVKEYKSCKKEERPTKIYVDNVAIGKGAYDRLRELKLPVIGAHASGKAKDKKFYWCAKAEAWGRMRDWFRDDEPLLCDDPVLTEQLCTVREKLMSDGRFMVESKQDYKKRNKAIGSPDEADALVMTFYTKQLVHSGKDAISFM